MRAIVFDGPGLIALREVPAPTLLNPEDALVRVTLAGICGTDLHVIAGDLLGLERGAIVGQEFVGDIVAIGAGVSRLKVGDHVMASDFTACGHCRWCTRGDHWECSDRAFFGTGRQLFGQCFLVPKRKSGGPHAETTSLRCQWL
jgi:threonine dehydrogenase-like Zn-dependent dehydrogenase